jgi:ubiquinone/menaquinone biosynthesis C-methylase UbiE
MEQSLEMWAAIGVDPQKRAKLHVLDLACGCGIKTFVLARDSANAHITCVDSPDVLTVARQLADRMGISAQVSFKPGDLQTADLDDESYDLAFLGQITYFLTQSANIQLFAKLHQILSPGGLVVIDAIMGSEAPSEFASVVTLLTHSLTGGAAHTAAEYEKWLQETGFGSITVHSETWLSAVNS